MIENLEENKKKLEKYLSERENIKLDIVDLSKVLAYKNGVNITLDEEQKRLDKMIPNTKHTVFVILDGFGYYKLKSLPETSILRQNLKCKLRTVNPTSTACVLTSVMSASYPTSHGIFGWWDYNKEYNLNYYPLLFAERRTGKPLEDRGITVDDIYKFDTIFDKYNSVVNIYSDRNIINSSYSKKIAGNNAKRYGYYSIKQAFASISKKLNDEQESTFNYLYIDGLDANSHMYGTNSKEVAQVITAVENGIKELINNVPDVSIILTADHGQVDMASMIYLNQKTNFLNYFYAMPSIDTRMISFFVRDKFKEEFEEKFMEEFKDDVILLKKEEIEKYNLFGNQKLSKIANDSLGEYIAIIVNNKFMVCDRITLDDKMNTKGNHSGLTKEETTIPLIII